MTDRVTPVPTVPGLSVFPRDAAGQQGEGRARTGGRQAEPGATGNQARAKTKTTESSARQREQIGRDARRPPIGEEEKQSPPIPSGRAAPLVRPRPGPRRPLPLPSGRRHHCRPRSPGRPGPAAPPRGPVPARTHARTSSAAHRQHGWSSSTGPVQGLRHRPPEAPGYTFFPSLQKKINHQKILTRKKNWRVKSNMAART